MLRHCLVFDVPQQTLRHRLGQVAETLRALVHRSDPDRIAKQIIRAVFQFVAVRMPRSFESGVIVSVSESHPPFFQFAAIRLSIRSRRPALFMLTWLLGSKLIN